MICLCLAAALQPHQALEYCELGDAAERIFNSEPFKTQPCFLALSGRPFATNMVTLKCNTGIWGAANMTSFRARGPVTLFAAYMIHKTARTELAETSIARVRGGLRLKGGERHTFSRPIPSASSDECLCHPSATQFSSALYSPSLTARASVGISAAKNPVTLILNCVERTGGAGVCVEVTQHARATLAAALHSLIASNSRESVSLTITAPAQLN